MGSLGQQELPPGNSPDIRLTTLTQKEHLAQTDANSGEWSGALNKEQYFRREAHLLDQDLTRNGRLTAWGLIYQPNGAESRQVLAGCETYAKKGLVVRNGKVEEGIVHGVGSVFSPPEFRGKGYAGRMMKELGEKLKTWQADWFGEDKDVIGSVLYSDIGKKFYAARGWKAFPSAHVSLPPLSSTNARDLPDIQLLKAADLSALCDFDEKFVRRRMENLAQNDDKKTVVALLPDIATIKWHHAREDFVANELFSKKPEIKGVVAGEEGERVWCYWTRVFTNPAKEPPVLHILRLVVEDPSFSDFDPAQSAKATTELGKTPTARAIAACFAAAQEQAMEWKMSEVMMWNPTSTTLAAAKLLEADAQVVHREDESIASLLFFGQEGEVDWVCNEKYGWC